MFVAEPSVIGGGATAAGMGHIVVMDDSPAQIALTKYSRNLWMHSRRNFPPMWNIVAAGTLWVAADAEEMAEVERKRGVYESIGVRAEVLDAAALAEAEPNLRAGIGGRAARARRCRGLSAVRRALSAWNARATAARKSAWAPPRTERRGACKLSDGTTSPPASRSTPRARGRRN